MVQALKTVLDFFSIEVVSYLKCFNRTIQLLLTVEDVTLQTLVSKLAFFVFFYICS